MSSSNWEAVRLEERDAVRSLLTDVIFLQSVGLHPILVHGGGKDIDKAMAAAGITPRKIQGRRYTDAATLEIVANVLAGDICGGLVNEIRQQGGNAIGLSYRTQNCLIGKKLEFPSNDGPVDLGFVGEVIDIDHSFLEDVCSAGIIPVVPSVAVDASGQMLNVNADTAAAAIARILKSEKLIFVSDVPGIFLDRHNPATLQSHLTAARCRELIRDGIIDAGMVPKVEAALSCPIRRWQGPCGRWPDAALGAVGDLFRHGRGHGDRVVAWVEVLAIRLCFFRW